MSERWDKPLQCISCINILFKNQKVGFKCQDSERETNQHTLVRITLNLAGWQCENTAQLLSLSICVIHVLVASLENLLSAIFLIFRPIEILAIVPMMQQALVYHAPL